jgi:hypothetical protein
MSETLPLFSPDFNRAVKIEVRPEQISTDAGALVLREVDHRYGLSARLATTLRDDRLDDQVLHQQPEVVRTMLLLAAQGWRDQDDATQLRDDPVFRVAVSARRGTRPLERRRGEPTGLASQPTLSRMLETLSGSANRSALRDALLDLAVARLRGAGQLAESHWLDVDSIGMEVHGHQRGAEYNGHYRCTCYHPLVAVLGEAGDLVGAWLRPGRASAAGDADELIPWVVGELRARGVALAGVRLDAGFPSGRLLGLLEQHGIPYVARIRSNSALDRELGDLHLLPRLPDPDGSEPAPERLVEARYAAKSWDEDRRSVCVVVQEPGELFNRHFYLVTSYAPEQLAAADLLAAYRQRGTAEGRFGEWMSTVPPSLSSTTRRKKTYRGRRPATTTHPRDPYACNDAQLLVSALAYSLIHVVRCLLNAAGDERWGLRRVFERVLKAGARLRRGQRRITFVLNRAAADLHALVWKQLAAIPPPA